MDRLNTQSSPRILIPFLLIGLAWGLGFLFIRVAVGGLQPLQLVFGRLILAAVTLTIIMVVGRRNWPRGWLVWRRIAVLSIFMAFLPFFLFALAGQRIPSALSSIFNSSVPIFTVFFTILVLQQETISARKLSAIVLGAVGILIVISPWQNWGTDVDMLGQAFALIAVMSYGFGFAYTQKTISPLNLDPVGVSAGLITIAAVISAAFLPFTDLTSIEVSPAIIGSLLSLGVLSSGLAYVWNLQVIAHWGAASASMVTYLTTIIGVFAGVIFLNEIVTVNQILGAGIVLVSIVIGLTATARKRSPG